LVAQESVSFSSKQQLLDGSKELFNNLPSKPTVLTAGNPLFWQTGQDPWVSIEMKPSHFD